MWCAPDGPPPPLSRVYRETIRVALRDAALAPPAGDVAEHHFLQLAHGRHEAVAFALRQMLRTAPDAGDRRAAARGLGLLRRPDDAVALADALAGDPDPVARGEVAVALGSIGGHVARRALRDCIADETPAALTVRLIAVNALYATGHDAAPAELAVLARTVTERAIRQALRTWRDTLHLTTAEWTLLGQTDPVPHPHLDPDPAVGRTLAAQLRDEDPRVAASARRWLWVRELWLAGAAARRHDATVARVPGALDALDHTDQAQRLAARQFLTTLAGQDLGAAASAWRAWWHAARATW